MYKKHVVESKTLQLTYFSKQKVTCPACGAEFPREELLSGSGRLLAGELTDELRRTYTPSQKDGRVYPLVYSIGVCPQCYLALFWNAFTALDKTLAEQFLETAQERSDIVKGIFPYFDFKHNRTLIDGAAAHYLALLCYEKLPPTKYSTTMRRAMLTLRLAWISNDLHTVCPDRNYDYIASVFYQKAMFFYNEAVRKESNGEERIGNIGSYGPDLDKNYGFDGCVYLTALLYYKYGPKDNQEARLKALDEHKRALARMFGLGKSSKAKPGPLLEHSRDLYDKLTAELKAANALNEDDDE